MTENNETQQIIDDILKPITFEEILELRRQARSEINMLLEKGYKKGTKEFKIGKIILMQYKPFGLEGKSFDLWLEYFSQDISKRIEKLVKQDDQMNKALREIKMDLYGCKIKYCN